MTGFQISIIKMAVLSLLIGNIIYQSYTIYLTLVHVGQCGNQLGHRLLCDLYENSPSSTPSPFFSHNGHEPRSILIDMEPKAIYRCIYDSKKDTTSTWSYNEKNVFYKQSGR